MRTEDLIVNLAGDAGRVRALRAVHTRLLQWVAVVIPVVIAVVALAGPRSDLAERLGDQGFVLSVFLIGAVSLSAAATALTWSVPGHPRTVWLRVLPFLGGVVWGVWLLSERTATVPLLTELIHEPAHVICVLQAGAIAVVPALGLGFSLRRAALLQPAWAGALTLVASLAAGAVGSELICPIGAMAHRFVWHFLPVIVGGLLGVLAGLLWLDRFRGMRSISIAG